MHSHPYASHTQISVGAVRRLSGATPLSRFAAPSASQLGALADVVKVPLAGRDYFHLVPLPPAARAAIGSLPVQTLLLWSPNRSASEELESVVGCALATHSGAGGGAYAPRDGSTYTAVSCF